MRHARLVSETRYCSAFFTVKPYTYFTRVSKRPGNSSGLVRRGTLKYISFGQKKYILQVSLKFEWKKNL